MDYFRSWRDSAGALARNPVQRAESTPPRCVLRFAKRRPPASP